MYHSFDVEHARQYGVSEAIFIQSLAFWIQKNSANERHAHEGKTWTYNSVGALTRLFPYWSPRQLRTVIENLLESGVILTRLKETETASKVTWYAFADEAKFLPAPKPSRFVKSDKSICQIGTPVCQNGQTSIIGTDTNTVSLTQEGMGLEGTDICEQIYEAYPRKVGRPDALKKIKTAVKNFPAGFILQRTREFAANWEGRDLDYCPYPSTWFNQQRFNDDPKTWKRNEANGNGKPVIDRNAGTYNSVSNAGELQAVVDRRSAEIRRQLSQPE